MQTTTYLATNYVKVYPGCQRFSKRIGPQSGDKRNGDERRGEKTSGCLRQLIDLTAPIDSN